MAEWVVVELGPKAEGEDPDLVRASIRHSIRDAEVFIPVSVTKVGEERVIKYLVEGYAFIKRTHPDATYMRLENTKYVQSVLRHPVSVNGGRAVKHVAVVKDADLDKLRSQIHVEVDQGISVGDKVLITSGAYKQIEAYVETEIPEHDTVQVHITLRSVARIITLPRAFLKLVERAQRSPLRERLIVVRSWFHRARPVMQWTDDAISSVTFTYQARLRLEDLILRLSQDTTLAPPVSIALPPFPDLVPVQQRYKRYERFLWLKDEYRTLRIITLDDREIGLFFSEKKRQLLLETSQKYERFVGLKGQLRAARITTLDDREIGLFLGLTEEKVRAKEAEYGRLHRWVTAVETLDTALETVYSPSPSPAYEAQCQKWAYYQTLMERLDALQEDVAALEAAIHSEDDVGMPQNLVIDGTQLAIRCMLSPGLSDLKDKQGRPTGAIMGFCQSLAGLKKKYPTTTLHVAWDSSNQRRKKMFAGYKASRSDRSPLATFEIHFLRNLLPMLGVQQAYNPYEEADDVIATLVRKRFVGQDNGFLSTDRDLLQLVSSTDRQFVPAVGAGKEKVYTVESVVEEYGVEPSRILQVRALSGDTSDDIPGADGIGLKTASKLVKVYGTLDRLFASNFAGLTKKQTDSIRAAEKQVRLNLELMQLQDDLDLTIVGPNPDQIAATERLREVDIKPESLLAAFFPDASGLSAHV